MKPNFFIIGAPKCGTTAMSEYLSGNPGVFFSDTKEPNHFSSDLLERTRMDRAAYLSLFDRADAAVHRAVGEASTTYLFSRRAVPDILEFNPEARFIVMLRNPVDLARALHSERVFEGRETLLDFEQAWRAEADRREGRRIPPACWGPQDLLYSQWARLGEQMERLFKLVPRERVRVILFDDFTADPAGAYARTLDFLGLPQDGRRNFEKINQNKRLVWPPLQVASGFLAQCAWWVKKKLGITRKFGFITGLLMMNTRTGDRKPIRGEFRLELLDFFREDVEKLSALLGRDLSHWTAGKKEGVD